MQYQLNADADALTPGNEFLVHTLDTSHAGFIHHSAGLARLLIEAG
ncbi:hypothetical protein [Nocardia sp. X0981]